MHSAPWLPPSIFPLAHLYMYISHIHSHTCKLLDAHFAHKRLPHESFLQKKTQLNNKNSHSNTTTKQPYHLPTFVLTHTNSVNTPPLFSLNHNSSHLALHTSTSLLPYAHITHDYIPRNLHSY